MLSHCEQAGFPRCRRLSPVFASQTLILVPPTSGHRRRACCMSRSRSPILAFGSHVPDRSPQPRGHRVEPSPWMGEGLRGPLGRPCAVPVSGGRETPTINAEGSDWLPLRCRRSQFVWPSEELILGATLTHNRRGIRFDTGMPRRVARHLGQRISRSALQDGCCRQPRHH